MEQPFQFPATPGTGLNNPHKTSENEKWEQLIQKEREAVLKEATQRVNSVFLNFYSEFIVNEKNDSEIAEKFKKWSKEHLGLDSVII